MKQHISASNKSVRLGLFFCFLVFITISLSLSYKGILLLRESKYTNDTRFTVLLKTANKNQAIVTFDTLNKKQLQLIIKQSTEVPSLVKSLELPIDATILTSYSDEVVRPISEQLRTALLRFTQIKTELTLIDITKLYLLSKSVQPADTLVKTITLPQDSDSMDQFLSKHLIDPSITKDNQTIEVINASGVLGAGSKVEHMLSRMGATVVAVTTARAEEEHTLIQFSGEKTYSVSKLQKLSHAPLQHTETKMISDIIIKIGKDRPLLME